MANYSFVCHFSGRLHISNIEQESDVFMNIVGGETTSNDEWPWHLELISAIDGKNWYGICGATLINAQWAVTAGHCVTEA